MKHLFSNFILVIGLLFLASSCSESINDQSDENLILEFRFDHLGQSGNSVIDHNSHSITSYLSDTYDFTSLKPSIVTSPGAIVSPSSEMTQDFSNGKKIQYLVESESGMINSYFAQVLPYSTSMTNWSSEDTTVLDQVYQGTEIQLTVIGTGSNQMRFSFDLPQGATSTPQSGSVQDISQPIVYRVTPEHGEPVQYTVSVEVVEFEESASVRAVWVPTPNHSSNMNSYDQIQRFVNLIDELNMNAIYMCAWAQGKTTFPSEVLVNNSTYTTTDQGYWYPNYNTGSGDPIKDLIDLAHQKNIKVLFWFEYGFMARWGAAPTESNDPLLGAHPEWASKSSTGNTANYNGTDFYYNGYHETFQEFMLDLVVEAVQKYDIDGVQGDDRMPAMPFDSGYDSYTMDRYVQETGREVPSNAGNNAWFNWRLNILNEFAGAFYDRVKAEDPECIVASAPNIYPWSKENLMQDWPTWLSDNHVELLSPQCYRYSASDYEWTVKNAQAYADQNSSYNLFNPGVLLATGSYVIDEELLRSTMLINRELGTLGEAFFYDSALDIEHIQKVLKTFYTQKVDFPELK